MGIYFLVYFIVIYLLFFLLYKIYFNLEKNISNKYFSLGIILYVMWLIIYFLSFSTTTYKELLLIMSRSMYGLSITAMYSILLSLIYYNGFIQYKKIHWIFCFLLITFFSISLLTPFVVNDMIYDNNLNIYYEKFGFLFNLYYFLYLIYPLIALFFYFLKIKKLNTIKKIRFKLIFSGYLVFEFFETLFLGILPNYGIWLFQKEQIIFFIPFVSLSIYSIHKYYFINLKYGIGKILVLFLSLFWTIILVSIIKNYFFSIDLRMLKFWGILDNFIVTELLFGIVIFLLLQSLLSKIFLGIIQFQTFEKGLLKLQKEIPYISNFPDLNSFLILRFSQLFKIKYTEILLLDEKNNYSELVKFFKKDTINDIFINDIVFIEENKNKFDKHKISKEIKSDSYLIFPLFNNIHELLGFFCLGQKPFGDTYNTDEIGVIKDFIEFISGHLKYLRIYDKINDLNINLDKKIDEKTMQYNTLINKQKDFISLISHEIKGPIGSSVFQVDCLLDDIEDGKYDKKHLETELGLLNGQLLKIGDLTNKLFSIEKYDIGKIELLKEKVDINDLLTNELELLIRENNNIKFNLNLDDNVGFLSIDKVQFVQVIDNLINNAIKFVTKSNMNPKIHISTYFRDKNIFIEIEDNGKEFEYTDISSLFEKYTTGKGSSIGLGMGLYLCKKIISLHSGEINAVNSEELGGARFIIILPK